MGKILVGFILTILTGGASAAAGVKDCHVGASPWREGRQADSATSKEYRLETFIVESLNKKGKPVKCRLTKEMSTVVIPNGFDPSIDHPGLPVDQLAWVKGCGNPIVSKFKLMVTPAPTPVAQVAAEQVVPTTAPIVNAMKEGAECRGGNELGTYRTINGRMSCLLNEVRISSARRYRQAEPEVVYEPQYRDDVVYSDEGAETQSSSWLPWAIGGGVTAAAWWWNTHRNNVAHAALVQGRMPAVTTGGVPGVVSGPAW